MFARNPLRPGDEHYNVSIETIIDPVKEHENFDFDENDWTRTLGMRAEPGH